MRASTGTHETMVAVMTNGMIAPKRRVTARSACIWDGSGRVASGG